LSFRRKVKEISGSLAKLVAVDYALTRVEGGALKSDLKGVYAGNLCFRS